MNNSTVDNNTWLSNDCSYREPNTDLEFAAKSISFVVICILGIIGNVFIIVLAVKYTIHRNLHHLIINMAVSDAIFLIVLLLANIPWISAYKWTTLSQGTAGTILCKGYEFILSASFKVTLITLMVISIERFRATRTTLHRPKPYTLKQRLGALGGCWLIPVIESAYYAHLNDVTTSDQFGLICQAKGDNFFYILNVIDGGLLAIISSVIITLSYKTVQRLSQHQEINAHITEKQRKTRAQRTHSAVRMVLVSVILYMCCWIPLFVLALLDFFERVSNYTITLINYRACLDWDALHFIVFEFLPIVNSCFSPVIYIIFLPDFRKAAKKVTYPTCCSRSKRRHFVKDQQDLDSMLTIQLTTVNHLRNNDVTKN